MTPLLPFILALFEKHAWGLWKDSVWPFLLLPLCLGISIVYKAIRCDQMKRVPREAIELFVVILVVMLVAAGALAGLVTVLER